MPADKVTHGTAVDESRGKTGPRHAAPRKPLFTRFQMPAGKAIALAAMPTAVLMGMGFTPTLANADDQPASNAQQAEEYKACVAAMTDDASASASPSETPSESSSDEASDEATPTPSASADDSAPSDSSSSDSGSDDEAEPTPTPSASTTTSGGDTDKATPTPSASVSATEESGNLLETIGDAIVDVFTGGSDSSTDTASTTTTSTESTETTESTPTAAPTPAASPAATAEAAGKDTTTGTTTVKDTKPKVTEVLKDVTDTAAKATEKTTEAATKAADEATTSPSPSASATTDVDDCPVATEDEGGVDNTIRLPAEPWTLQASSLLLTGADYQGIVKVRTADGTVKDVLKYVISGGTEIGDLHQLVKDDTSGKTYHVQAAKGSKSTINNGKTVMYTESISGNLFGLIPVTFTPKSPPPLNIPLIYFTNVKVIQAGQFGGTLTVPGLHQYTS